MNIVSEFDFINTYPPLGHPEHHFNKYPDHPWLKSEEDIRTWCLENMEVGWYYTNNRRKITVDDFKIDKNLCVELKKGFLGLDVNGKNTHFLIIKKSLEGTLPVQFLEVERFLAVGIKLKTLIGSPYSGVSFTFAENELEDYTGLSSLVEKELVLSKNKFKSFKNLPKFNSNNLLMFLENSKITSWDGFTNCNALWWWQNNWCDKTSYDLLMQTPLSVNEINLSLNFKSKKIVKDGSWSIDMRWLRGKQLEIQNANITMSKIQNNLDNESSVKKRKI